MVFLQCAGQEVWERVEDESRHGQRVLEDHGQGPGGSSQSPNRWDEENPCVSQWASSSWGAD